MLGNTAPSSDSSVIEAAGRGGRGGGRGRVGEGGGHVRVCEDGGRGRGGSRSRGGGGRTESRGGHGSGSGELPTSTTAAPTSTTILTTVAAGRPEPSNIVTALNDNLNLPTHECSSCLQETIQGASAVGNRLVLSFSKCPASQADDRHVWVQKSQPPLLVASTGKYL